MLGAGAGAGCLVLCARAECQYTLLPWWDSPLVFPAPSQDKGTEASSCHTFDVPWRFYWKLRDVVQTGLCPVVPPAEAPFPAALCCHHQQPAHTFVTAFHGDARLQPPVPLPSAASPYSSRPFCHLCKAPLCCEGTGPHLTASSEGAGHNHHVKDFPIFRENTDCAVEATSEPSGS